MQLAPATLSVICAALSTDGVNATHPQIAAALAVLTGGVPASPLDLQPGEFFLVDHEDDGMDTQHSVPALQEYLQDQADAAADYFGRAQERTIDDFIKVYICRREVKIDSERSVKVTIA